MPGVLAPLQPFGLGAGLQSPFVGANPAAAANFTLTLDGNFIRRLLSLVFTLATDANAANRYVTVEYRGKDNLPFSVNAPTTLVTAGSTERFAGSIAYSVSDFNTGTDLFFPLDPVFLMPGDQLVIAVASMQAGDTLTGIRGVVEQFTLDPARLPEREP